MLILAAVALAASHPGVAPAEARPLITAEADGSFIIHEEIVPDDPPVEYFTNRLISERCPRRGCAIRVGGRIDRETDRRRDPSERAFEEAVDQAREARRD
jgi:hypothetical protein